MLAAGLFTALASVPAVAQKSPAPQNVLVVNGSGQPVPTAPQGTTTVAGTVNVGNTPSVSVINTPSVNVTNTPSVNVANTPTVNLAAGTGITVSNPLDAQNNPAPLSVLEAVQFYDSSCAATFNGGSDSTCSFQAVPSGKRLVIEEFDSFGLVATGINPLVIGVNTFADTHVFPATSIMATGNGFNSFTGHQQTRLYLKAGVTPQCHVILNNASGSEWDCQISGFLVDFP
jgi:hypothetical protein